MPLPVIAAAWVIAAAAGSGGTAGGVGFKKKHDAKKTVQGKQDQFEAAQVLTLHARVECEQAFVGFGEAKVDAMREGLVPFQQAFSQLKNVDLEVEVKHDGAPELDPIKLAEAGRLSMSAMDAISGALQAGAAGAIASYAAVQGTTALAAAGTGTAISSLSGAAASNATLAWLGGGTLASGGGGMAAGTAVLSGVAAAPVMLVGGVFLLQKGRDAQAKAKAFAKDADRAIAQEKQSRLILSAAETQARNGTFMLRALVPRLARECGWLQAVVERETDWRRLGPPDRERIRRVATIAMATSDLVHTPVMAEDGSLTSAIRDVFERAATIAGPGADG